MSNLVKASSAASQKMLSARLQEFTRYTELKQLAYNIAALQQEKLFRSLAVLSFFPGEGKTLFCAALAMAYMETCQSKVLVVDTSTFRNENSLGLKQCLAGSSTYVDVKSLDELRNGVQAAGSVSYAEKEVEQPKVV